MKRDLKFFLPYRIIMAIFYFLILLTMFIPMYSIDQYVEYEFHNQNYIGKYQSYNTPLASKITPLQLMENLGVDDQTLVIIKSDYASYKLQCDQLKSNGTLTEEDYNALLAEGEQTNKYYVATIYNGTADYARIQDKIHLISIVTIVIYGLACVFFIFNVFNLIFNEKFLYIVNAQSSWIYALTTLAYIIYIFATCLTNYNDLEGTAVTQTTMVCMSASGTMLLMLALEVLYAIFSIAISTKFGRTYQRVYEVPEDISYQVQATRRITAKKSQRLPADIIINSVNKPTKSNLKKKTQNKKKRKKKHGKKR